MNPIHLELLLEFGVILLAPLLHAWWLHKSGRATREQALRNLRIFVPLYLLLGAVALLAWLGKL